MHKQAKKIVEILNKNGYVAYYAGGWVRDYLLGYDSDDIDIATDAPSTIVQSLFSHTVPIGEAFGIILVVFEKHSYEVATFRKDLDYKDGRRPSKVSFTTAIEDAERRDFTINGMFFDPVKEEVIDYVKGQKDLKKKIIKAIGDPNERFKEDRLRMLRAIRLAVRFDFTIEKNTKKAILSYAKELKKSVAIERIFSELQKMAKYKTLKKGLLEAFSLGILQNIFPSLEKETLEDIEKKVAHLDHFPEKTPVILKILELFPNYCLKEKISLCKYLKLSNKEIDFVLLQNDFIILEKNAETDDFSWAHFYAKKDSFLILQIYASHFLEKKEILKKHEEKKKSLLSFIKRIKDKDPLIKSSLIKKENIAPGPKMGFLLKEAEKISINEKIEEEKTLMKILKKKFSF